VSQHVLKGHTSPVNDVAFRPHGQLLASVGNDGTLRLWNPRTGVRQDGLTTGNTAINSVAFSPNGKLLAGAGENGKSNSGPRAARPPEDSVGAGEVQEVVGDVVEDHFSGDGGYAD
jgi:WD40 repeat protein